MKIYILKCEDNKYYVGRTKNMEKRVIQHFTLNGSKWTKKYKPIEIINHYDGDEFDEEKYTLLTMDKYGIENVRGGSYCKMKLSKYDIDKIQQTIYSIMDKCYKCGKKGHFVNDCGKNIIYSKKTNTHDKKEICIACNGSGRSYWSDGIHGSCLECCCIKCRKFNVECSCTYCDNCKDYFTKEEKHTCYECGKCGEYVKYGEESHYSYKNPKDISENHDCKCCNICNKFKSCIFIKDKCMDCYFNHK
jgi:hypothetical protein